jgi:DUF1009 family protein
VSDILTNAEVDTNLEEEVLLAIDVAHFVSKLDLTKVPVLTKGLGLPF